MPAAASGSHIGLPASGRLLAAAQLPDVTSVAASWAVGVVCAHVGRGSAAGTGCEPWVAFHWMANCAAEFSEDRDAICWLIVPGARGVG